LSRGVVVVTVTGSECTGKTTLARDLAGRFGTVWVPEFARDYVEARAAMTSLPLGAGDVEPIARGQIAAEDRGIAAASRLVVLDTDLMSTTVYARHYYGACPAWIEQAARDRRADLYLLCDIDVPWVADRARDRPHMREHMHALFVDALEALGARYMTIRGGWDERLATAIAAVDVILRAAKDPQAPDRGLYRDNEDPSLRRWRPSGQAPDGSG
jgi:NadR type nicotinamide-nucleotide adenylyltransferase